MSVDAASEQPHVLICGSGCAGSLLAWILARQGRKVVLVDSGRHPRFAIGESSTPLADFLLELIAEDFNLPELKPLARWGSWQSSYPKLRGGKKRGFSYYGHTPNEPFQETSDHEHSLLVAASVSDELSDTHWLRADVDEWLCQQAVAAGVQLFETTKIQSIQQNDGHWSVTATRNDEPLQWQPQWLIDATGAGGIVPRSLGVARFDDELLTQTGSLFGHFIFVQRMTGWLDYNRLPIADDTFDGDDAAQHHVLSDGWIWMLRFDCGITSVGITRPTEIWQREGIVGKSLSRAWDDIVKRYPTVEELLSKSDLFGPMSGGKPTLGWMPRLSRLWAQAAGERWLALPSTVGVVDPLHSTGLAHALSGVRRAAEILLQKSSSTQSDLLHEYNEDVIAEVRWIDRLVSTCYAGLPDFDFFTAASSFYFLATVACETELRDAGTLSQGFLGFKNRRWQELVQQVAQQLSSRQPHASADAKSQFLDHLRESIQPWNTIGLLDPIHRNRFSRSATKLAR